MCDRSLDYGQVMVMNLRKWARSWSRMGYNHKWCQCAQKARPLGSASRPPYSASQSPCEWSPASARAAHKTWGI